ncbi:hypothetical protein V2J09_004515 [Rumex salicifolius]
MASQVISMFFLALLLVFLISGGHAVQFTITNNCPYEIWPATLTPANTPAISNTGFALTPGASNQLDVPTAWSGRIWARTGCTSDSSFSCLTGECGTGQVPCNGNGGNPPVSLVEMTLNANDANKDTYDISLVDGFNLPVSVTPAGSGCETIACSADLNGACPSGLTVTDGSGAVIACKSMCLATNEPQYCCTGEYHSAEKCVRSDYSTVAKQQCPQAYSFAFDDSSSTFTCAGGSGYTITFCP